MKLGLGLYRHMLTSENYRFARQCGCTHVVAHLVDYFNQGEDNERENQPTGGRGGGGGAGGPRRLLAAEGVGGWEGQGQKGGLGLAAVGKICPRARCDGP